MMTSNSWTSLEKIARFFMENLNFFELWKKKFSLGNEGKIIAYFLKKLRVSKKIIFFNNCDSSLSGLKRLPSEKDFGLFRQNFFDKNFGRL